MEKVFIVKDLFKKNRRFGVNARTLEFKIKNVPQGVEPVGWIRSAIEEIVLKGTEGLEPTDKVGFTFCSVDFSRGSGWMRFKPLSDISMDDVWDTISSIYQSNSTGLNTESFCLGVTSVKLPVGRARDRKYNSFDEACKKSRGIIVIDNNDNLCLPRALSVAIARVIKDPLYNKILRDTGKLQRTRAMELLEAAGISIPAEGSGIPELQQFQRYLEQYNIVVYQYGTRGRDVIFEADSISQYDAIRAYLKELDITNSVWIGLSRTSEKPNFSWSDFQPLSGDGHWQEPIPLANKDPMCVAMDPAKDFLWRPMSCGGPEIASFICEMQIPSWALGPKGCLLTELPSLTVLYIPEQSSLELTSDCGLDGTKRIVCKGNANREELLKQLTCTVIREDLEIKTTTKSSVGITTNSDEYLTSSKTTKSSIWTSNTIDIDYGVPTRHRRETEDTLSPVFTKSTIDFNESKTTTDMNSGSTNYDTQVTTNSLDMNPTSESTVTEKYLETETTTNIESSSMNVEPLNFTTGSEANFAVDNVANEFTGNINQGHLFSIIGNGTVFDIIDLNDTAHETKATPETTNNIQETDNLKTTKKLIQKNEKFDKMKEQKTKTVSKTEIYKSSDPKKINFNPKSNVEKKLSNIKETETTTSEKNLSIKNEHADINREFFAFPIMQDSSIFLNRTFRKQPPKVKENSELNEINGINFQDMSNSVDYKSPDMEFENLPVNKKSGNDDILSREFVTATQIMDIDPKIDILNNNMSIQNNESEIIEFVSPSEIANQTFDSDIFKSQFLSKTFLDEKAILDLTTSSGKSKNTTEEPLGKSQTDQDQPRPNRQRQLTRPQRKSFYPYFFSRVLG